MHSAASLPPAAADAGVAARCSALALQAVLLHTDRGDARQALQHLLSALARTFGAPCELIARDHDGRGAWRVQASPGLSDGGAAAAGAGLKLPLSRMGRELGELHLQHNPHADAPRAADLEPVCAAAAALLLQLSEREPAAPGGYVELMRGALRSAGAFAWEWDIDRDMLSDIDEGLVTLGYDGDVVGRTQSDWDRLIHPEDRAANHEAYLRHASGETEVYEHAYRILAADGSWRWYLERGRIVEWHADGRPRRMLGTQSDISEQREREQAALQAAARLERIAHNAPGVLYQFELSADFVPRFSYLNERARELLGLDPVAAAQNASALMDRIDDQDREAVVASIVESAHGLQPWQWEFRVHPTPDTLRWIRATSTPRRGEDGSTTWHGYMQDVTELRELERARRDKAAAEAANRAKTEFLSRMSHELRTPLNAVLGFSQLLEIDRAETLSEGQRRRVRLIRESGEHLLRMIGDLLDLTRIESGSMQVQIDAVPLHAVADEAVSMLRPQAEAARVQLTLRGAESAVRADRTRLRQVLLNLLSNAIKYNRPGGTVDLTLARAAPLDGQAAVSVEVYDTGLGIAAADLPHLFEPFNRLAQSGSVVEGTGIGLSVTRALVTLMHGRIQVRSEVGVGSTFVVLLPAA